MTGAGVLVYATLRESVRRAAGTVWAKSDQMPSSPTAGAWMPLTQHLDDTAAVAGLLWDSWVSASVRRVVTGCLGDEQRARRVLVWLAGVHDVGKASPAFAVQFADGAARMADAGLRTDVRRDDPDRRGARHEVVGHLCLVRWLRERHAWRKADADRVAVVVGGHHGAAPTTAQLLDAEQHPHLVGDGAWVDVQNAFLERQAATLLDDDDLASPLLLSRQAQVLLTALVIVADWIASNSDLFPYRRGNSAERAAMAWRELALPAPWQPSDVTTDADQLLADRFDRDSGARPLQRAVLDVVSSVAEPGLVIVEAPMGEGKTEAALLAAEVLAARTGAGGCFVALPTQATTDAMFNRVHEWMQHLPGDVALSTFLAHGKASLNDTYRGMLGSRRPVSIAVDGDSDATGWAPAATAAVVHQWLTGRKKGVLSSFVVGTVDQTLFAALKSKHLVLRHLALAGKVVIVDEVHAYDAYMGSYLERALHWLGAYGVPVILLSATLPAARRAELVGAYQEGAGHMGPVVDDDPTVYPIITATDGDAVLRRPCEPAGRRTEVHLEIVTGGDDELRDLGDRLETELAEGGCALVVRNTVRRAQEAGRYLAERFGDDRVTVTHARYVAGQRAAKDVELLRRFGPPGPEVERPEVHVVVGTQVVEQSLDVDFDLLVSDMAPMDLLLQRMGRLHRHDRGVGQNDRPTRLRTARCLLTGVDPHTDPRVFEQGSVAVYREAALHRAAAVLLPFRDRPVVLPDDIAGLVQAAYGTAPPGPPAWQEAIVAADRAAAEERRERQRTAAVFRLGTADGRAAILGWVDAGAGEVSDDDPRAQAHVRDGDPSLEVLVVVRRPDGLALPPWLPAGGGRLLSTTVQMERPEARLLAASALRLPASMTRHPRQFDAVVAELERDFVPAWQSDALVQGQLVLVLAEDGTRELSGRQLRYTEEFGLEEIRR